MQDETCIVCRWDFLFPQWAPERSSCSVSVRGPESAACSAPRTETERDVRSAPVAHLKSRKQSPLCSAQAFVELFQNYFCWWIHCFWDASSMFREWKHTDVRAYRSVSCGSCAAGCACSAQLSPAAPAGGGLNEEVSSPGSACSFPAISSAVPRQTVYNVRPLFSCHVETFTRNTHVPVEPRTQTHMV